MKRGLLFVERKFVDVEGDINERLFKAKEN
jgi:hypothetical protein